ncbi:uncharacterized protein LY79DRAFT_295166 [Colletotrichum navitas]|uniref:Uncharacterized protein n=1 Tax=Colletotrichum navitas TaxID=681940 RepID=A0AAD8V110_9PEZI|nr:uncharacterized protein LY79DRAFT_295166 [Colletotrichum navitas]KAK1584796.1 hypothetical protein LY79DRAFT_295166 [Colletotrichum navitas]
MSGVSSTTSQCHTFDKSCRNLCHSLGILPFPATQWSVRSRWPAAIAKYIGILATFLGIARPTVMVNLNVYSARRLFERKHPKRAEEHMQWYNPACDASRILRLKTSTGGLSLHRMSNRGSLLILTYTKDRVPVGFQSLVVESLELAITSCSASRTLVVFGRQILYPRSGQLGRAV